MYVYQVVFDKPKEDGTIIEVVEYVESSSVKKVAIAMDQRAEEMEWDLKSVRYALAVVEKI